MEQMPYESLSPSTLHTNIDISSRPSSAYTAQEGAFFQLAMTLATFLTNGTFTKKLLEETSDVVTSDEVRQ